MSAAGTDSSSTHAYKCIILTFGYDNNNIITLRLLLGQCMLFALCEPNAAGHVRTIYIVIIISYGCLKILFWLYIRDKNGW